MKRIISAILCLACLCGLMALSAAAAPADPLAVQFQAFINDCDSLYAGDVVEYALSRAKAAYVSEENPGPVENVPAEEFETELSKYIVLSEELKTAILSEDGVNYDSLDSTYTLQYSAAPTPSEKRQYKGYVKTDENTYAVYYQEFEREALNATAEVISQNKNPITGNVEYNGKVYVHDSDGKYYCVKSWKDGGMKYSVEMIDGKLRFVSGEAYNADAQPETFDDAAVTYDLPQDNTVYLSDIAYFPGNTTVKVEKITRADALEKVAQAMANVSTRYVPYEFTAMQGNTPVQPTGKQEVCFAIPEDFGVDVAVMYMASDGQLTDVPSDEKNIEGNSFLFAKLEHFSTYILVDKGVAPAPTTEPTTAPTAEATTAPTTAATQATTAPTAAATGATTAATKATDAATKVTAAATKPVCSLPLKPTVPATEETVADPTGETVGKPTVPAVVDPTDETPAPTDETIGDSTQETQAKPTDTPKKSNKTGVIIAIVIVVLAGGGAAAWWFFFKKKKA